MHNASIAGYRTDPKVVMILAWIITGLSATFQNWQQHTLIFFTLVIPVIEERDGSGPLRNNYERRNSYRILATT